MPRFKTPDYGLKLIPVDFAQQVLPGTFEFALCHLVDNDLDLSTLRARYTNDAGGAPAFDPAVLLKIVLLGYSRGQVTRYADQAKHQAKPDALWDKSEKAKHVREAGKNKRYANTDFTEAPDRSHCLCPAGKRLYRNGAECTINGYAAAKYTGAARDCVPCEQRTRCLRTPETTRFGRLPSSAASAPQRSPTPSG
jgi:hypothetical protein